MLPERDDRRAALLLATSEGSLEDRRWTAARRAESIITFPDITVDISDTIKE